MKFRLLESLLIPYFLARGVNQNMIHHLFAGTRLRRIFLPLSQNAFYLFPTERPIY